MAAKDYLLQPPDPLGQVHAQLSNVDKFLLAREALKSKNPPEWETLAGLRYLAGFVGSSYNTAGRWVKAGKIPGYKIGGTWYVLIPEVITAINENREIDRLNWLSYEDDIHSQIENIIHWKKYLYPDHVLVKYTFQRETFYTLLPANLWTRDYRIGNILIKLINKHIKR